MKIEFKVQDQVHHSGATLIYRSEEQSFDMVPVPRGCVYSVLISHYFELDFDDDGQVMRVGGLCPYNHWKPTRCAPPPPTRGSLVVTLDGDPLPGVSYQVAGADEWPVLVNRKLGWVCIGEPTYRASVTAVEFLSGCIAVLEDQSLRAVWLHPESLPPEVARDAEVTH
jgi:hypothetical protein